MKARKMRKRVYSWNPHSKGARALAKELGWLRVSHKASRYVGHPWNFVVNWGSSQLPGEVEKCHVLNRAEGVQIASDKLATFTMLHAAGVPGTPWFTVNREVAEKWRQDNERTIVTRTVLNGHGGQGIRIARHDEPMEPGLLYVEYVAKKEEYRVHVMVHAHWNPPYKGPAEPTVFVQKKVRRLEVPDDQVDWRIRNHGNGFNYAHDGVAAPQPVIDAAIAAVKALGLSFGAVDVGWNEKHGRACVFEVNTAPGLEGTTLSKYAEYFRREFLTFGAGYGAR